MDSHAVLTFFSPFINCSVQVDRFMGDKSFKVRSQNTRAANTLPILNHPTHTFIHLNQ